MFNKLILLIFCCLSLFVCGSSIATEDLQVGRYQIAVSNQELVLLDTATGYLWKAKRDSVGLPKEWWPVILTSPEPEYKY